MTFLYKSGISRKLLVLYISPSVPASTFIQSNLAIQIAPSERKRGHDIPSSLIVSHSKIFLWNLVCPKYFTSLHSSFAGEVKWLVSCQSSVLSQERFIVHDNRHIPLRPKDVILQDFQALHLLGRLERTVPHMHVHPYGQVLLHSQASRIDL